MTRWSQPRSPRSPFRLWFGPPTGRLTSAVLWLVRHRCPEMMLQITRKKREFMANSSPPFAIFLGGFWGAGVCHFSRHKGVDRADRHLTKFRGQGRSTAMSKRILSVSYDVSLLNTRQMLLQQQGYTVTSWLGFTAALAACKSGA